MKRTLALIAVVATGALALAACGGDDGASDADRRAIDDLVTELNRVTAEKDAAGFCAMMQPSRIEETFSSRGRCVRETKAILEQAGDQPTLDVESIEVEGDTAEVKFAGRSGPALLVREDGKWYIPLAAEASATGGGAATGASGETGAEG